MHYKSKLVHFSPDLLFSSPSNDPSRALNTPCHWEHAESSSGCVWNSLNSKTNNFQYSCRVPQVCSSSFLVWGWPCLAAFLILVDTRLILGVPIIPNFAPWQINELSCQESFWDVSAGSMESTLRLPFKSGTLGISCLENSRISE